MIECDGVNHRFIFKDLDGDDVMILDSGAVIYIWVGANANMREKEGAKARAEVSSLNFYLNIRWY